MMVIKKRNHTAVNPFSAHVLFVAAKDFVKNFFQMTAKTGVSVAKTTSNCFESLLMLPFSTLALVYCSTLSSRRQYADFYLEFSFLWIFNKRTTNGIKKIKSNQN